jgi:hypothetical protein
LREEGLRRPTSNSSPVPFILLSLSSSGNRPPLELLLRSGRRVLGYVCCSYTAEVLDAAFGVLLTKLLLNDEYAANSPVGIRRGNAKCIRAFRISVMQCVHVNYLSMYYTNSMELVPCREAPSSSAAQKFSNILCNRKILLWSLSGARQILSISSHPFSLTSIFLFSFHLRLDLPSGIALLVFPPTLYMHFSIDCLLHIHPF